MRNHVPNLDKLPTNAAPRTQANVVLWLSTTPSLNSTVGVVVAVAALTVKDAKSRIAYNSLLGLTTRHMATVESSADV